MGLIDDKALELFKAAMEDYGIEPGELYESIDQTLDVIDDLKPVVKNIQEVAGNLEGDVEDLLGVIESFNENAGDLADALDNNAETLEKFAEVIEDMEDDDQ